MKWMKIHNAPSMGNKRRDLRVHETPEEKLLWERLRNKGIKGTKFKRQHSVGGYIVDFYCASKRLVIELDGFHHLRKDKASYDQRRTDYLNSYNITVIRFMNYEVRDDIQSVIDRISKYL